jgi:Tfp pilus assembly protein PilV
MKFKFQNQKGSATLEILIAFAILVISITAVILVVFGNQSISVDSQTGNEALYKAQAILENTRATAYQNFDSLTDGTTTIPDPFYTITKVISTDADSNIKYVTSTVAWKIGSRNQQIQLATTITNRQGTNTCNPIISGDWSSPQYTAYRTDTFPGSPSNGLGIADLKVYKDHLYIAANSIPNGNGTDKTFYILKLATFPNQLQAPTYEDGVKTDSTPNLTAIAISPSGKKLYAYLAASSTLGQLQIIDITDSVNQNSMLVKSYPLPNTTNGGHSIFYKSGYIYLGLVKGTGIKEFNIIDVHDPLNPIWKGGYSINGDVNSITVKGNYAYLAIASSTANIIVLDISNPQSPTYVTNAISGTAGTSVYLFGSNAYLGRLANSNQIYSFDVSNPAVLASPTPFNTGSQSINGLSVRASSSNKFAFILTDSEFQVRNIANWSNPISTVSLDSLVSGNSQGSSASACTNDFFYLAIQKQGSNKDYVALISPKIQANQTITVTTHAPASATYNSTFPVAATSNSGLTVAITTTGGCSISGGTVTMTSGTTACVVHYNQSGNSNYGAAPEVTETTNATKAPSVTTVTCPASVTYSGSAQTPCTAAVTGTGGLNQSVAVTYTNNVNAGTATANASYAGDTNHAGSSDSKNFTINKATPTITWSNPTAITYGTALSATQLNANTGGVAGTFTYTPASGTVLSAGANQTLSVHFVPTDTANYNTPTDKTVSITVNQAVPSVTPVIKPSSTITAGTVVHDEVTISSTVTPTGTVDFVLFKNGTCGGGTLQTTNGVSLVSGFAQSPNFTTTAANKPKISYQITYHLNSNYVNPAVSCQQLTVN